MGDVANHINVKRDFAKAQAVEKASLTIVKAGEVAAW